jgi:hypothetical protein
MTPLDALAAQVQRNIDASGKAVTLIRSLAQQIEELKADPVKLQGLADSLKANADSLEAVIPA